MLKELLPVLFMVTLVFSLPATSFAQSKTKAGRVEGRVIRSDKDKSNLTVRAMTTHAETAVSYDASTKWVSQYHGDTKINTIDASEVKDGDRVICLGSYDDKGILHAATISKRLSHSPQ